MALVYAPAVRGQSRRDEIASVPDRIKSTPLFRGGHTMIGLWAAFLADDLDDLRRVLADSTTFTTAARYRAAFRAFSAYELARRGETTRALAEAYGSLHDLAAASGMNADVQLIGYSAAFKTLLMLGAPDAAALLDAHLEQLDEFSTRIQDLDARRVFLTILPWNVYVRELRQQAR